MAKRKKSKDTIPASGKLRPPKLGRTTAPPMGKPREKQNPTLGLRKIR